jgi:hypothetical protein
MKIAAQAIDEIGGVSGLLIEFSEAPDGTARLYITFPDDHPLEGLTRDWSFDADGEMTGAGTFVKPKRGPIEGS